MEITHDIELKAEGELKGEPNEVYAKIERLAAALNESGLNWKLTVPGLNFTRHNTASTRNTQPPTTSQPFDGADLSEVLIEELGLNIRPYNCLKRAGNQTVGDVVSKTARQVEEVPNMGRVSRENVEAQLNEHGLSLREDEQ